MLLIKCPQCNRSYRLAESLYRRKAAGYGVVITCRHCKTQIHVDEETLAAAGAPAPELEPFDADEVTPPSREVHPVPVAPTLAESEPPQAMPLIVKPAAYAGVSLPPEHEEAVTLPPAAPVAVRSGAAPSPVAIAGNALAAPSPAAIPRPQASPPRPLGNVTSVSATPRPLGATSAAPRPGSATGTPLPVRPSSATGTPLPIRPGNATGTPLPLRPASALGTPLPIRPGNATGTPLPVRAGAAPRPGANTATGTPLPLRGSTPATNGARPNATPTPNDTAATPTNGEASFTPTNSDTAVTVNRTTAKAKLIALSPGLLGVSTAMKGAPLESAAEAEGAPESGTPLSIPDAELFDIDGPTSSKPPDSAVPIDSVDYLESLPPPVAPVHQAPPRAAVAPEHPATRQTTKRMPHAPHAPHPPQPAPAAAADNETPRRRVQSGDLSDDFLNADLGFDRAAPAIAPPDANSLLRAPVSLRPPGTSTRPGPQTSTRAPVSSPSNVARENKSSGRGIVFVLVAAVFGSAGYYWTHRLQTPAEPGANTVAALPTTEPAPAPVSEPTGNTPVETAPTATVATAEPQAAETATSVPAEKPAADARTPSPAAGTPSPAAATPSPAAVTPSEKSAKTHAEKPARDSSPTDDQPAAPTKPEAAPEPAPAATTKTVVEPRGPVGTEPFDVAAARSALEMSAEQASSCRKDGDPSGVAVVTITFSQTGRVTTANISGPPFQATPTGGCIASTMRRTRVPPFAGDMVTVRKTVTIQ